MVTIKPGKMMAVAWELVVINPMTVRLGVQGW